MNYSYAIVDDLREVIGEDNLADRLAKDELESLGSDLVDLIDEDEESRSDWIAVQEQSLKLAAQVRDSKTFPWSGASNMKYPLMTTAAMQFHARALPGLINHERPVLAKVIGNDPDGKKAERSERVSRFMSYQVLEYLDDWMDNMDRLLFVLPIVGLCFKKTYHSDAMKKTRSVLVLPSELIINYHATDYATARMSHIVYMNSNEVITMQRKGLFLEDVDLDSIPQGEPVDGMRDETIGLRPTDREDGQEYKFYESHCFLDLDGDGYKEPYVVTVEVNSKAIVRIVPRWGEGSVEYNEANEVITIVPIEHFTAYQLIPDPNSAVYALGFGALLGPTNETVNTLINQLIDAGTLSNLQSGFIGRGARLKGGATRFRPGEWKLVNTTGDDLRKAIFPMPVREPSSTLFSLLQMLISSGQQITSVSDMMMGENPGQNQKATTTMAVLEQGLSVFKGIYKRLHRSLQKELKKLAAFNVLYLDEEIYHKVLDDIMPQQIPTPQGPQEIMMPQGSVKEDFNLEDMNILPTADPSMVSDAQRVMKGQSLLEKLSMGLPINPMVVTKKVLEAEQHEDIPELMTIPPKGPSPEELNYQLEVVDKRIKMFSAYFEAIEKIAKAESLEEGTQLNMYRAVVDDMIKVINLEGEANKNGAGANQQEPNSAQVQPGGLPPSGGGAGGAPI